MFTVMCSPDGTCSDGENVQFCPEDCDTGGGDQQCDLATDGVSDPDCAPGVDPDYDPTDDTDGDGVADGSDLCPLTPAEDIEAGHVNAEGCACSQLTCADEDLQTVDTCEAETATCEYLPDNDADGVANADDNCPDTPNPDQADQDQDGVGDACEIGTVTDDLILDGGEYDISDPDETGAITIGASNITLDCGGATISGDGQGYGIYLPDTVSNVTIRNCHLRNYRYGIYLDHTSANTLTSNILQANHYGIVLNTSGQNTLARNRTSQNTNAGIYVEDSASNVLSRNTANDNGNTGIFLHTADANTLSDNEACGNLSYDIVAYNAPSSGLSNSCAVVDGWNDDGSDGCTLPCLTHPIFLPIVTK
jgi:parallel beta-helix repeat protein